MNKLLYLHRNKCLPPGAVALYLPTEEGRNLLKYSQQFDNAAWTKANTTITANDAAAPDGSQTADRVTEIAVTGWHGVGVTGTTVTQGTTYTGSIYLKKGSGVGAPDYIALQLSGWLWHMTPWCMVNLATGQITGTVPGAGSSIESVGDGWYRVRLTATASIAGTSMAVIVAFTNNSDVGMYYDSVAAYAGNAAANVLVWGAQLEQGSVATTYYPTTDKQILKDYANRSRNLLLPNQANAGEDGAATGFVSFATGNTITSDAFEHWQGDRCIKCVTANATTAEGVRTAPNVTNLTPGSTYTASAYLKGSGTVTLRIYERTDADVAIQNYRTADITLTDTWTRYVLTDTFGPTARAAYLYIVTTYQQAATIYVDGLQLEEGLVATDWQAPPNHGILGSSTGADTNDPAWTGQGLSFDGVDDYVTLSGFDPVNTARTACSVFVVMKMDTLVPNAAVIGQYDVDGQNRGWLIRVLSGDQSKFEVMVSDNGTSTVGHLTEIPTRDPVLTAGTYAFIGFTFDSGNIVQYAGPSPTPPGTPIATGALTIHTPSIPVRIGTAGTVAANLTGTIAAVMGHSRALSDAEVAQAYAYLKGYLAKFGVMLQ